jgi:hypothetical protein
MNEQNRVMRCYVTFTKAKIFLFAPFMKDIKKKSEDLIAEY